MLSSRLIILHHKVDLTAIVEQHMTKDEAMLVVKQLRKARMPQPFYNLLADALTTTDADKFSEEIQRWERLLEQKIRLLNGK